MRAKKPTPISSADESFGDRAESTEAEASDVLGVLNLGGDVLDDVVDLLVAQVAREARHVGGAGADRFGDLEGRNVAKRRGERAEGERVAVTFDGVTGRAVEREERHARRPHSRSSGSASECTG